MGRRLIFDTNMLIAFERGAAASGEFDDDDIAITALTVAEYRVGIEMADSAARAAERSRALSLIVDAVELLDYTGRTAVAHAQLLAHVRRVGRPRSAHDLIIAAHALQTERIIVSRDAAARFADLPGVVALDLDGGATVRRGPGQ